jgi:undecaprenyl-phosphate 4-deoxy-4-formamido-L-arabinose transferase
METPTQYGNDAPPSEVNFSVVVPCYNEADSIGEFHQRLTAALDKLDHTFDIIYVNDGSTDATLEHLIKIHKEDSHAVTVVDLVQNVGQTNALTAGIRCASGRHIVFLDCDLQVAPEDLAALIAVFDDSYDMVGGARQKRKDNYLRVHLSRLGNAVIRRVLGLPLYDFGSGMKVLNGAFVRAFEPGPFRPINPGAMMMSLRRVAEVPIQHHTRINGRSRWTLRRFFALYHNIFKHLIPFVYPFTVAPFFLVSLLALAYFVLAALYPDTFPGGNHESILPILLLLNISLSFFQFVLLGEFVLRGNSQVQEPAYIVRRVYSSDRKQ